MKKSSFFFLNKSNSYILSCILLLFLFSPTTLYAAEDSGAVTENQTQNAEEAPIEIPIETPIETEPIEVSPETPSVEITVPELPAQDTVQPDTTNSINTSGTEETFTVEKASGTYYINSSGGLNVRRGPSTSYDVIGSLPYGKEINITGKVTNDWFEIDYQGAKGYIAASYVSTQPVTTTTVQPEEESAEAEETLDEADKDHTFTPYFTNAPIILLFLAIAAVLVLIVITVFSFFRHNHASDEYYDDEEYYDESYHDEDDYDDENSNDSYDDYE